jgi:hypothetical protein
MIIFRGRGILIAVVTFGCLLLTEVITESAAADERFYQTHGWPKLLGFCLSAACVWAMRPVLGVSTEERPGTTATPPPPNEAELFFVKARYWPAILVVLGLVFLFVTE